MGSVLMMILVVERAAVRDFRLHVVGNDRHGDHLAVGMRDGGAGRRAEILEHQHVAQA